MLTDPIGRVRAAGLLEGVSLLLLLGVAMPLKYLADQPEAVRVVGWCHGILFIFYCLTSRSRSRSAGWRGRWRCWRSSLRSCRSGRFSSTPA